jgi:hypothetical protein
LEREFAVGDELGIAVVLLRLLDQLAEAEEVAVVSV